MKILVKVLKKLCLGIFGIYSVNVLFGLIDVIIPINVCTIAISSFLGISGILAIIFVKLTI